MIELLVPNPTGADRGFGGGDEPGARSSDDDGGGGFQGFAEADAQTDFKTKYYHEEKAVEMYDGHKAQLNMDPYYTSRVKRHTYTLCEVDEKGAPKMHPVKGPDGVVADRPMPIPIDGDGILKKAFEKRERERTGNLGVRGWRFKSAKGDEKYEFDADMWEKLENLGLARKKKSKDKDKDEKGDDKVEEKKEDAATALENRQIEEEEKAAAHDEEMAEVQQNDAKDGGVVEGGGCPTGDEEGGDDDDDDKGFGGSS